MSLQPTYRLTKMKRSRVRKSICFILILESILKGRRQYFHCVDTKRLKLAKHHVTNEWKNEDLHPRLTDTSGYCREELCLFCIFLLVLCRRLAIRSSIWYLHGTLDSQFLTWLCCLTPPSPATEMLIPVSLHLSPCLSLDYLTTQYPSTWVSAHWHTALRAKPATKTMPHLQF